MSNQNLIIVGPSASGKTELAIETAKKTGQDILSADSRQVYKGLDYSTGKLPVKDSKLIKHDKYWGISNVKYCGYDLVKPNKEFSAADFVKFSNSLLKKNSNIPIVCGGTGLYIKAITGNLNFSKQNQNLKNREMLLDKSAEDLLRILEKEGYKTSKLNNSEKHNKQRLIRKIEMLTNKTDKKIISLFPSEKDCLFVGITLSKKEYTKKVKKWITLNFDQIVNEVTSLEQNFPSSPLFSGFIFKEIKDFINKKTTKEETKTLIVTKYLQYIKRQKTYFNNQFININWFSSAKKAREFINSNLNT